jgi:ATP phosphoribosyltransferase
MLQTAVPTEGTLSDDAVESRLPQACRITPGLESPTAATLSKPGWVAAKAMTRRAAANLIIDDLHILGARGIAVTDTRTCRL